MIHSSVCHGAMPNQSSITIVKYSDTKNGIYLAHFLRISNNYKYILTVLHITRL